MAPGILPYAKLSFLAAGLFMVSLNDTALSALKPALDNPAAYGVTVETGPRGVTLMDFGINAPGGYPAGIIFAKACLAGMAEVNIGSAEYGALPLPTVSVAASVPVLSCMASQYAGWAISKGKFFAMGSGPARAIKADEEIFREINHKEESQAAVLCLETSKKPAEEAVDYILEKLRMAPERVYILLAPTNCPAGSVQVSARALETAIHKMHAIGFKLEQIVAGSGSAPIAPVAADAMEAIGRTNDCVLYGAVAHLTVDCDEDFLWDKIVDIPSSNSKDYGKTFGELFRQYGDFYKIDPLLFSPARVTVANRRTGSHYSAGKINPTMLHRSFSARK